MPKRFCRWIMFGAAAIGIAANSARPVVGYEKIRFYEFGESDPGAVVGGVALVTHDSQSSPTYGDEFTDGPNFDPPNLPSGQEFVDLYAPSSDVAPIYAPGRLTGLSMRFTGESYLEADAFDPRPNSKGTWTEVDPNEFSYTTVSQAWVKPDSSFNDTRQVLWTMGPENGGVAITADGKWEIVHPNKVLRDVDVTYDQWTHVAMRRHGNGAILYINGEAAGESSGFWGSLGTMTVGAGLGGVDPYSGLLDDLNVSTYGGPTSPFAAATDIDFFTDIKLSGVTGDVDQDGVVNQADYLIWSANSGFDSGIGFGDPNSLFKGDVDQNGRINYFDFQIIAEQAALAGAPLQLVPEPTSACLLLSGCGAFAWLRRRNRR